MSPGDQVHPLGRDAATERDEQVARLERQLTRARSALAEAETISERVTRELYDKHQGLVLLELIAKAANAAAGLKDAMATGLEAIRRHGSWPLGHLWLLAPQGSLVSSGLWAGDLEHHASFCAVSENSEFAVGVGLPGRVLAEGMPLWLSGDDDLNSTLPRGSAMAAAGLRTALVFPIFAAAEVVGVLEFFADREMEPDEQLLGLMAQVGTQLGRVVERRRAIDELRHQSTHDALTGLPNRVLLVDQLMRALSRQRRRGGERTAVFFIDLDGFKAVNDTLGHAAGDRVLRHVADRLGAVVRPHDTLGRLSGDEFVIVCEALTEDQPVVAIAERVGEVLREPIELEGEQFIVTASVGIALADGGEEPGELIEHADAAMYRSKELGRARYEIFSEELRARIARRLDLERALRHAVEREELCLHYQPQVDLSTGAIAGVEALLRWQRPGAMVMPNDFIPLAEETGLVVPIGAWVLDEALRQLGLWQANAKIARHPWMSVNLSVRQLSDPALMGTIAAALAHHHADPADLFLEVTESVLLDDAEAGLTVLTALRSLGTELAIDDFGTGYASLSYLRRFPASVIKIDRFFVAETAADVRTRSIVSAIVAMSRGLGLTAVAEGIETAEQLAAVRELGCDIGQGYYFARPCPAAELTSLLETSQPFASRLSPP